MAAPSPQAARAATDWATYRRLLTWVRPYRARIAAGFIFGLLYSAANGAFVWVIKGGIQKVFHPDASQTGFFLAALAVLFPAAALLRGACDFASSYFVQWVGRRVVMDLRNAMFRHMHTLPAAYFTSSRTGEIISRITNDTTLVESSVSGVVTDLAKQPATLVGMVIAVFLLDARLAAVSVLLFPVCVLPILAFGRRVRRAARESQERMADVVSIVQESVSGVRIVKAFGMEEHEISRFSAQTRAFFGRMMRVARASASVEPVTTLIAAVGIALLLLYVRWTAMPVDRFLAFVTAYFLMYEPVKKLSKIHMLVQQGSGSADRIFEILDTESTVRDAPHACALRLPVRDIVFDRVSFAYGAHPVLEEISLRVAPGEKIALVGSSGAGKTTLVSLLPRFYDVTGGRILINGVDIRDLTLASLRGGIGLVSQDTFLFNTTVAENIAYGQPAADAVAIEDAARRAQAHTFIEALPQGYNTVVGERGVRLSGGQCQRLSIARALLRNPPILILDEATSALDTESERTVQAAIDALIAGRTVFAIAHRLSTIANCDRILVLDGGRVVEEGSHAQLLAAGGRYRRLYDLQFDLNRT
jgi:subfamily B ATP-binding cassette protein MsbA